MDLERELEFGVSDCSGFFFKVLPMSQDLPELQCLQKLQDEQALQGVLP